AFAVHLQKHVFRSHPLSGTCVMRAARSVDVVVAAVKSVVYRTDPALELHLYLRGRARWDGNPAPKLPILRAAAVLHGQSTGRQQDHVTVAPVNLRLKIEIRGEPLGLRWKHMPRLVAKNETCRGGLAVEVLDAQLHLNCGSNVEQDGRFAAKAKVVISLADFEPDRGLARSRFAAVEEGDGVFGPETAH